MIIRNKYLIILVCLIIISCSKELEDTGTSTISYWGEASVLKNSKLWESELVYGGNHPSQEDSLLHHPGLVISIETFNASGYPIERLGFNEIPCEVGKFALFEGDPNQVDFPTASYITIQDGFGDVLGDVYRVVNNSDNFIEIFSLENNEVKANFELFMVRDTSRRKVNFNSPDSINFRDGFFHTKLNIR